MLDYVTPSEQPLPEPDRRHIETFVQAVFKHAPPDNWIWLETFFEGHADTSCSVPIELNGDLGDLIDQVHHEAGLAARNGERIVFCLPTTTFTNGKGALAERLTLSIECHARAGAAHTRLEELLSPATVVADCVTKWEDPETGESGPKRQLHYRLKTPASSKDEQEKLKLLHELAAKIGGGNPPNGSLVRSILWPGSLHCNGTFYRIVSFNPDTEIDLDTALEILSKAVENGGGLHTPADKEPSPQPKTAQENEKDDDQWFAALAAAKNSGNPASELRESTADDSDSFFDGWDAELWTNGGEKPGSEPEPAQGNATVAVRNNDNLTLEPDCRQIELVLFTKRGGPLTKRIFLAPDGTLANDSSACRMARGTAERVIITDIDELAALIESLHPSQAIALGSLRGGLPDKVKVTTEKLLNGGTAPGTISRSRDYLTFGQGRHGFCLGDFDRKGITAEVRDNLEQSGGFVAALGTVIPELKTAGYVVRASTSAGLFRTDTEQQFTDSGGVHLYLGIKDVSDSNRFLKTLHGRCWIAGFGWYWIGKAGQLLERSIIDHAVAMPEHLCFEGPPLLGPGLAQDKAARMPKVVNGDWLDTQAACPPLNPIEQSRLKELQTKAAFALNAECARVRTAWLQQRTTEIATSCGITEQAARAIAIKHAEGVLLPAVELTFANPAIGVVTVGDVLADPDKYVEEALADPWEGPSYGRQTAMVLRRPDGSIFVNSWAHGGQTFELKLDADAISKILASTDASNVVDTMINHVLTGSLDEVEVDTLARQAAEQANVGLRPVQQKLKQARAQHDKQQKAQMRTMALMNRTDPRPQHDAPFNNAPWLPEMAAYDAILNHAAGDIPPSRHIEDELNCARCTVVPGTHAFSSDGSDDRPAPQWNIYKLDNCDAANLLEKHIDFIDAEEGYSVQCPPAFVNHYRQWHDSTLPKLVAISPLPLVLGNGEILSPRGLDRLRGIAFIIDDKLRQRLPFGRIGDNAPVTTALDFLLNDWLVDVSCSFTDKCTAIALALTMIERSLLAERPVGFVTSPTGESGKTTLTKMLVAAVTGLDAVAFAWSFNEEERRKALLSYFDAGLVYVLWDNIPDGALISCPHLERSCTASYYADRKLGVSEFISTAAATIHLFTGINIAPRGAFASRSLDVRVDTDLVDPMARTFVHNDPIKWTKNNREQILGALYTILLGNPMLDLPSDAPTKTRFPMWYRLVGSAVEHAATIYREVNPQDDKAVAINFGELFLKQKTSEEEGTNLGGVLIDIAGIVKAYRDQQDTPAKSAGRSASLHAGEFIAKELTAWLNEDYLLVGTEGVRGFLFQKIPTNAKLSPHAVGTALAKYVDKWRVVGSKKLVLRVRQIDGANVYRVDQAPV